MSDQTSKDDNHSNNGDSSQSEQSNSPSQESLFNEAEPERSETQTNESKTTTPETNKPDQSSTSDDTAKSGPWVGEEALTSMFDRISDVTSSAFKFAKKTTDTSYKVGKAIIQSQDQLKLMVAAGQSLKDMREVAGLTVSELSDAINLKDKSVLEAVENGTATLSFELILRLSALLARNDPIPFILKYSRTYAPDTWKLLNDWGAGRLPLQYQREREFINIFRSQDQARQLSDEGFLKVLEFTRHTFNLSLHFIAEQEDAMEQLRAQVRQEVLEEIAQKAGVSSSASTETKQSKKQNNDGSGSAKADKS